MTLWDIIRNFYVQYIFGGYDSNLNSYSSMIGYNGKTDLYTDDMYINIGEYHYDTDGVLYSSISIGDWLSTTFTIITLIVFVIILYIFLKWLFKTVSGLILLKR